MANIHTKKDCKLMEAKAINLLEQGVEFDKALIQSGYKESYARSAALYNPGTKQRWNNIIEKTRSKYLQGFVKEAKKCGLGAKKIVGRLDSIISRDKTEKDNFNTVQAIKEYHRVIVGNSKNENVSSVNLGIFMIPSDKSCKEWETVREVKDET